MAEVTRSISSETAFESGDRLLERLREGEEEAFTEAFQLYKDMVYTVALRLLADKSESLDVTQDVFLILHRKVRSFRGDCALKTWLYRVAVNQAANRNRWWKRRSKNRTISLSLSAEAAPPPGIPGREPSPAREFHSGELREAVCRGLGKLPFDQRSALVLREVEGLGYEEISEILGVGIGTVKSRISRGREKLREALERFQGGELL